MLHKAATRLWLVALVAVVSGLGGFFAGVAVNDAGTRSLFGRKSGAVDELGLTARQQAALGGRAWIPLSLVESGWATPEEARILAEALLEPADRPTEMESFPVDLRDNTALLPSLDLPLPNHHTAVLPPKDMRVGWQGMTWGPAGSRYAFPPGGGFDIGGPHKLDIGEDWVDRGPFFTVVSPPGQWAISALVDLPALGGPGLTPDTLDGTPLGAYLILGLEAPGARVDAGLVWNPSSGEWEAFMWDNVADDGDQWRQGRLAVPVNQEEPDARLFVILEIADDGTSYGLSIFNPRTWSCVGWFRDDVPPAYALTRDNYAIQLSYTSAVATQDGPLPGGVWYENCGWHAVTTYGWCRAKPRGADYDSGWRRLDLNNTFSAGQYPETPFSTVSVYPTEPYFEVYVRIRGGEG